jgi:hypothetical protein
MPRQQTFCVKLIRRNGRDSVIASGLDTLAEAVDAAYRLTVLRQVEFGGEDEFCACPEEN